jgi:hypothetical protein
VGLRGKRERVRQFDGTLEIHSNEKGASILVTLPLAEEAVPPDESNAHSAEDQLGEAKPCNYEITSGTTYVPALKIVAGLSAETLSRSRAS